MKVGQGHLGSAATASQVAAKPYELQRRVLARSARVAVTKFAWSGREPLELLRDDMIVLHAMRRPDEVGEPSELYPPAEMSEAEADEAVEVI